jgi:hypothetical protein
MIRDGCSHNRLVAKRVRGYLGVFPGVLPDVVRQVCANAR